MNLAPATKRPSRILDSHPLAGRDAGIARVPAAAIILMEKTRAGLCIKGARAKMPPPLAESKSKREREKRRARAGRKKRRKNEQSVYRGRRKVREG